MIIGHDCQREYFNRVLQSANFAHAYLLHGPEHLGKLTFAKAIAKTFWCVEKPKIIESVCGQCNQCRMIDENRHPAVIFLDTDYTLLSKKEVRKLIPIEDIHEVKRLFGLSPAGSQWRIAIINEAEKLSGDAAGAFLKLLEEPGSQTLFFLVTSAPEALPQTIFSRAQPVRFSSVPHDTLEGFLKGKVGDEKERREILDFSFGRPGVLVSLLEKEVLEKEQRFSRSFQSVMAGGMPEAFRFTEKVAGDEVLRKKTAEYILRFLRNSMIRTASSEEKTIGRIKKVHRIASLAESTNVNPRLALDVMFLEAKT